MESARRSSGRWLPSVIGRDSSRGRQNDNRRRRVLRDRKVPIARRDVHW